MVQEVMGRGGLWGSVADTPPAEGEACVCATGRERTNFRIEAVLFLVHRRIAMRASVTLDDDLLRTAQEYTGVTERAELLREALKSLIAREAGRRLLALAGTAPNIEDVRRLRVDER